MIIDSSAAIAVMLREHGSEQLFAAITSGETPAIGAPTMVEISMVLSTRSGAMAQTQVARFLQESGADVIPFTADHWLVAASAFRRFGKGNHKAGLNFGDCMTYAIAAVAGQPLLCTGNDFAQTDLEIVRPGT